MSDRADGFVWVPDLDDLTVQAAYRPLLRAATLCRHVDVDGDGRLSTAEFVLLLSAVEAANGGLDVSGVAAAPRPTAADVAAIVRDLGEHFSHFNMVDTVDGSGDTVLHRRAARGDAAGVAALLAQRVNPNVVNGVGRTPLDVAAGDGVVAALRAAGARRSTPVATVGSPAAGASHLPPAAPLPQLQLLLQPQPVAQELQPSVQPPPQAESPASLPTAQPAVARPAPGSLIAASMSGDVAAVQALISGCANVDEADEVSWLPHESRCCHVTQHCVSPSAMAVQPLVVVPAASYVALVPHPFLNRRMVVPHSGGRRQTATWTWRSCWWTQGRQSRPRTS